MARQRLISCEVFFREFCAALAHSPHTIDVEFVPQGLHDRPGFSMAAALQERIDAADAQDYQALLLGYGLCNRGLVGIRARKIPLVITRAHDCITLFLGSRAKYDEIFKAQPGSYYLTSGWIERAQRSMETLPTRQTGASNEEAIRADFVARYGEENAQYLLETMRGWKNRYGQITFIDLGLGKVDACRAHAEQEAAKRGLTFKEIPGDLRLFRALLNGPPWDEKEFLVIPPGHELQPSYEDNVIEARPVSSNAPGSPPSSPPGS